MSACISHRKDRITLVVQRAAMILFFSVIVSSPAIPQKKLTAEEAKEHFGQGATVCGEVVSTSYVDSSRGQPTFLNLDRPYPIQIFTVVIWGENRSKFGKPENEYKGKRICVSGKITAYAGKPEIVVSDQSRQRWNSCRYSTASHWSYFLVSLMMFRSSGKLLGL